jgi:hypothetical protein
MVSPPALHSAALYTSLPVEVSVAFASAAGTVQTLEGPQANGAGDAIITGLKGEHWPVRREEFDRRYEAIAGRPGRYRKRVFRVTAEQLMAPRTVHAPSGAVLHGLTGSWVVNGQEGAVSVVDPEVFARSYALASIPVYVSLAPEVASGGHAARALAGLARLQAMVPATPLIVAAAPPIPQGDSQSDPRNPALLSPATEPPVWLRIVPAEPALRPADDVLQLPLSALGESAGALLALMAREQSTSLRTYSGHYLKRGLERLFDREPRVAVQVRFAAARLAAVDAFNAALGGAPAGNGFQRTCNQPPAGKHTAVPIEEPAGLARLHEIASVADALAGAHQRNWQEAVFTRTGLVAKAGSQKHWPRRWLAVARLFLHASLVPLGLLAAFGFATFSELAGGCTPGFPFSSLCASAWWKRSFEPVLFLLCYVLPLGAAWCIFARTKARKDETRHQDFRLLAECLRARYVRALLNEGECVSLYVTGTADSEAGWVHDALRSLHFAQPLMLPHANPPDASLERARQDFIQEQLTYHDETLIKSRAAAASLLARLGRRAMAMFLIALFGMAIHETFELLFHYSPFLPEIPHLLTSLMVVTIAFWGSMRKLIDVLGLEEEMERAEVVADALRVAKQGGRSEILDAINVYAHDQGKWHELHRGKSIEATTGG